MPYCITDYHLIYAVGSTETECWRNHARLGGVYVETQPRTLLRCTDKLSEMFSATRDGTAWGVTPDGALCHPSEIENVI